MVDHRAILDMPLIVPVNVIQETLTVTRIEIVSVNETATGKETGTGIAGERTSAIVILETTVEMTGLGTTAVGHRPKNDITIHD